MKGSYSLGLADILTVTFIVLKLVGAIDWPWLWVFTPFLIGVALLLLLLVIALLDEHMRQPHPHSKK